MMICREILRCRDTNQVNITSGIYLASREDFEVSTVIIFQTAPQIRAHIENAGFLWPHFLPRMVIETLHP